MVINKIISPNTLNKSSLPMVKNQKVDIAYESDV